MSGWVGQDVEGLGLLGRSVQEERGTEFFGALPVSLQLVDGRDGEVDVQLLRYAGLRPRRRRQLIHPLKRELPTPRLVHQHQPVSVILDTITRRLVTLAIPQPQKFPVELRQPPRIRSIQRGMHPLRVARHTGRAYVVWKDLL